MSNIYLKVTIEKKWRTQNFDFISSKSSSPGQFLGSSNSSRYYWTFKQNCVWFLYYSYFQRNFYILKSESLCSLLNKNMNFNKNETESKLENPTHRSREINLVLQLVLKLQIKSTTMMSWSSQKSTFFATFILSEGNFFNIYVISQCIVYWVYFQNTYPFTYQKPFLHTLLLLVFKIVKSLQCILKMHFPGIKSFHKPCSKNLF